MGFEEPELLFDICLHIGTLIAICIVFFQEIKTISMTLVHLPGLAKAAGGYKPLYERNEQVRITALIVIGTLPTALLGILFHKVADQIFGAVWIVGIMLLVTGSLLWFTRYLNPTGRQIGRFTAKDALVIGLTQGLAILPGISRSGSTISGGSPPDAAGRALCGPARFPHGSAHPGRHSHFLWESIEKLPGATHFFCLFLLFWGHLYSDLIHP